MNDVTKAIRLGNRVWNRLFYSELVETDQYQICFTPELPTLRYLSSAQAIRGGSIGELESEFTSRGLQPALFVDPLTPAYIRGGIQAGGYVKDEGDTDRYRALVLSDLIAPSPRAGLVLSAVDGRELDTFLRIVGETNGAPEAALRVLARKLGEKPSGSGTIVMPFLAKLDGIPASTVCLGMTEGFAYLSLGGTLEPHRRLGIFQALRLHCLAIARGLGCSHAFTNVAVPNEASQRVSDRSGFQDGFLHELWVKPYSTGSPTP